MLELRDIEKSYGAGARGVAVLRRVSLAVRAGEFCAVLGPSGSGKSTLLNIIGLLDTPDAGVMKLDGVAVDSGSPERAARVRNEKLGFVFQSFHLLPRLNAWQNVALPLFYRNVPREARREAAEAMLERVGLADRAAHRPGELSGGQRQRVALARALVGNPKMILADEPTGSLDSRTARDVMALLHDLNRDLGVTIIMVTHDRALAMQCHRQIEFLDGKIIADSVCAPC